MSCVRRKDTGVRCSARSAAACVAPVDGVSSTCITDDNDRGATGATGNKGAPNNTTACVANETTMANGKCPDDTWPLLCANNNSDMAPPYPYMRNRTRGM